MQLIMFVSILIAKYCQGYLQFSSIEVLITFYNSESGFKFPREIFRIFLALFTHKSPHILPRKGILLAPIT